MLYNSFSFMIFLPALLAVYYRSPKRYRNLVLTTASYVFYAFWDVRFISLLMLSTAVDYYCGRHIHDSRNDSVRRKLIALSVTFNLGLLAFFKYTNFFLDSLYQLIPGLPHGIAIILPVGISFYTFQSMSYTLDVYRGRAMPVKYFTDFAC